MATQPPPTILKPSIEREEAASKKNTDKKDAAEASRNAGRKLPWLWIAIGAVVVIGLAAAATFWVRHRHRVHASGARPESNVSAAAKAAPQVIVDLPLDPFVVNLADAGGHSYARIGLSLHIGVPVEAKKGASEGDAAQAELRDMVRDRIITVLNQQQSSDLLASNGKDRLKQQIKAAVAEKAPQDRVLDIYFTQFLVQP